MITDNLDAVIVDDSGSSLREAYLNAAAAHFPANGKLPPFEMFENPQYNTWIELMYNQNQQDIIKYAEKIISLGLKPGVIMIDDTWQEDYGVWEFHTGRFADPKAMIDRLH